MNYIIHIYTHKTKSVSGYPQNQYKKHLEATMFIEQSPHGKHQSPARIVKPISEPIRNRTT
jgi:hypothetical protein